MDIDFGHPGHPMSSSLGVFSWEAQSHKEQPEKRHNSTLGCFKNNMGKVFLVFWSCSFYLPGNSSRNESKHFRSSEVLLHIF